jgi:metal-dependent hydrolase (beta-lactamase superfamily II)
LCKEPATAGDVHAAMPHPVVGSAADPIALEPADDVVVTTLVDNVYDALVTGDNTITRAPFAAGTAQAPQFEPGFTNVGLMAEHGFSALVRASPLVHALTELAPGLLVPGHCTGWRAQHTLAAALSDSWVQGSSGTRYQLTSSLPAR